ncbi:MAG: sulfatase-like hydrolase/transferase [Acidobacteriota bacterium]
MIDAGSIMDCIQDRHFRVVRGAEGAFALPPRDVVLTFYEHTGALRSLTITGLSTGGPLDVPVLINGFDLGRWRAGRALAGHAIAIPKEIVKRGANELRLGVRSVRDSIAGEEARLMLLAVEFTRDAQGQQTGPGTFYYKDRNISGLWQTPSSPVIQLTVKLPADQTRLRLDACTDTGCRASVEWRPEGGQPVQLQEVRLAGMDLDEIDVKLEGPAGSFGTLVFTLAQGKVLWGSTRLMVPGEATEAVRAPARRFNLLIWLVDALRADGLETYGYARPTSPFLREFTKDCIVFTDVVGQASWTKPSVASLLTGLYPSTHEVTQHDRFLHPSIATLAERLHGFNSYLFTTHVSITKETGYAQGFDAGYYVHLRQQAPEVCAAIQPVLAGLKEPFFLYAHTIDPHYPYEPSAPFDNLVVRNGSEIEKVPDKSSRSFILGLRRDPARLTPADRRYLRSLYDAEVARADFYFGKLVGDLKRLHLYDDTMIVFTADHGEEFLDHGDFLHGHTLYQEMIHLPWIVKPPKGIGAPTVIRDRVRQIDLLPTLLDLLGIPVPNDVPGRSYAALFRGGSYDAGTVFSETELDDHVVMAMDGRWKLIVDSSDKPWASHARLFDLETDPRETRDVKEQHAVIAAYLHQELRRWELELQRTRVLKPEDATRSLSDSEVEGLKGLGYID